MEYEFSFDDFELDLEPYLPPSLKEGDECPKCSRRTVFGMRDASPFWLDGEYYGEADHWECANCGWRCPMDVFVRMPRGRRA